MNIDETDDAPDNKNEDESWHNGPEDKDARKSGGGPAIEENK